MILVCPQCRTGFQIPDDAVGPRGRRVRCGACAHVWHAGGEEAAPPDPQPEPETAAPAPEPEPDTGPDMEPASADPYRDPLPRLGGPAYGSAAVPALTGRRRPWLLIGWVAWAAFVLAVGIAVFGFRSWMLAVWPPVGGLYEAVGIEAPAPRARDVLSVRIDPDPAWQRTGESWALTVRGAIVNRADVEIEVPPMALHLVDENNRPLRRVRLEPDAPTVAPRGTLPFELRVADAPDGTKAIVHVWNQGD